MSWTTGKLADLVGATVEGDADRPISGVAALDAAGPAQISFCTGGRWDRELSATLAGAVVLRDAAVPPGTTALRHENPRHAFARIAQALHPVEWPAAGVHRLASVHPQARVDGATIDAFAVVEEGATVGAGSWIQAHAYVGRGASVGCDCRLMPTAVVMDGCTLGDRVLLKPGAVVGADGFGHAVDAESLQKVPQLGIVVLEDDVELGANASVDRAALGMTHVGRGSRIDNLVQVAHNVRIGAESLLAAFSAVAGGGRLGARVMMGGRATVAEGVSVGEGTALLALSTASKDLAPGGRLGGTPAKPYREWLKEVSAVQALPKALERIEARLRALEGRGDDGPR